MSFNTTEIKSFINSTFTGVNQLVDFTANTASIKPSFSTEWCTPEHRACSVIKVASYIPKALGYISYEGSKLIADAGLLLTGYAAKNSLSNNNHSILTNITESITKNATNWLVSNAGHHTASPINSFSVTDLIGPMILLRSIAKQNTEQFQKLTSVARPLFNKKIWSDGEITQHITHKVRLDKSHLAKPDPITYTQTRSFELNNVLGDTFREIRKSAFYTFGTYVVCDGIQNALTAAGADPARAQLITTGIWFNAASRSGNSTWIASTAQFAGAAYCLQEAFLASGLNAGQTQMAMQTALVAYTAAPFLKSVFNQFMQENKSTDKDAEIQEFMDDCTTKPTRQIMLKPSEIVPPPSVTLGPIPESPQPEVDDVS